MFHKVYIVNQTASKNNINPHNTINIIGKMKKMPIRNQAKPI